KRRRKTRRMEPAQPQKNRQHRANQTAPKHDANQTDADGQGEQRIMRPVTMRTSEMQKLPEKKPGHADARKNDAQQKSGQYFTAKNSKPIGQQNIAHGHCADDERGGLRTRVA